MHELFTAGGDTWQRPHTGQPNLSKFDPSFSLGPRQGVVLVARVRLVRPYLIDDYFPRYTSDIS
jgi:hypothetical protein